MTMTRSSPRRSLTLTTSPARSGSSTSTTLRDSLSTTCAPGRKRLLVDVGSRHHAHLAAGREHVDRAVVVGAEVDAERRRRLGELLDLFGEGLDLLALGAQRVGELLVLADGTRELLAGLGELVLEQGDLTGGVREPAPQEADLLFQEFHLALELVHLCVVLLDFALIRHRSSPLPVGQHPNPDRPGSVEGDRSSLLHIRNFGPKDLCPEQGSSDPGLPQNLREPAPTDAAPRGPGRVTTRGVRSTRKPVWATIR